MRQADRHDVEEDIAMDLLLTGTGPATGFPVPGCPCAACASSSGSGSGSGALPSRRPAELRLSGGAGLVYRVDIDGTVHGSDGSARRPQPGELVGLPGVSFEALGVGASGLGLLIHPDDHAPVLWAPQCGRLDPAILDGVAGTELGFAILGPAPETEPAQPQPDPPALIDCALTLAQLRLAGSVTAGTSCLLIGAGHRQGDQDRLTACLAHWGAFAPLDGTRIDGTRLGSRYRSGDQPRNLNHDGGFGIGGRTLVLGGAASGKSGLAEHLLAAEPEVLYTATGPIVDLRSRPDAEWADRVSRHRERRPAWWHTEETHEVAALLAKADRPVLLDSIGTWLTGVLDRCGAWQEHEGWRRRLAAETDALVHAWRAHRSPLVAVSDEVGWGVVPATAAGRLFRDELGRLNRRLADESERVLVVVAGRILTAGSTGPHTVAGSLDAARSGGTGLHAANPDPQ
jgi:adenosylcobinamide kinase / adenosylcobinamide-phosphate guanylyltransferase